MGREAQTKQTKTNKGNFFSRTFQKVKGHFGSSKKVQDVSPVSDVQQVDTAVPPTYQQVIDGYASLNEKMGTLLQDQYKHKKKQALENLTKEKEGIDQEYVKANGSLATKNMDANQEDKYMEMQATKQAADMGLTLMTEKVNKSIAAKEHLETYRGKLLPKLVKHADSLKQGDDKIAKVNTASFNLQELKEAGQLNIDRRKQKKTFEKSDKQDGVLEKTGLANTILQHGTTIISAISDGVSQFKFSDRDAIEKFKDYKWFDGFGDAASLLSLLSLVESGAEFVKACIDTHKRRTSGNIDRQEQWKDARMIMEQIAGLFSTMLGAVAPYTALVPLLGSILGIVDSGIQCLIGGMNLFTNIYHGSQMHKERKRIWAEIERKRKKYEKQKDETSAAYYTMEGTGKGVFKRSRDWSKIDAKRKKLRDEDLKGTVSDGELSSRISKLREERHQAIEESGTRFGDDRKSYKEKMRAMEALQLMNHYRAVEKAEKKMDKAVAHDTEGLAKNAVKIIGNAVSLGGEISANPIAAAAGYGINVAEGGYEMARDAGSAVYKQVRKWYGAEGRKQETRSQMADYLFDKMVSLGPTAQKWTTDEFFDLTVKDYKIKEYGQSMDELNTVLRKGLDSRMTLLLSAPTGADMKKALAAAFSQDEGVAFSED